MREPTQPTAEARAQAITRAWPASLFPAGLEEDITRAICRAEAAMKERCAAEAEKCARRNEFCPSGCKCAGGWHIAMSIRALP